MGIVVHLSERRVVQETKLQVMERQLEDVQREIDWFHEQLGWGYDIKQTLIKQIEEEKKNEANGS